MEKFHQVIFKLAETQPNAPLTPALRTLLQDRLNQLGSQYKTPDHPPYSAMIERALRELSEKRGSSVDSISQFLKKQYENLPWAHSMLLKHHLEKLCESGDILVTRNIRYMLAGEAHSLKSRAKVKKRWRTKWRWDWEKEKRRQHKKQLLKKINRKKVEKVERTKQHQESDEKEQEVTENGVQHSEEKQVEEDQTKRSLSFVNGENCISAQQETGPFEIMKPDTQAAQHQETGSFESMKSDTRAAQNQETDPLEIVKPDTLVVQDQETGRFEIMEPVTQAAQNQETGPLEIMKPDNRAAQNQETGPFEIMKPESQPIQPQTGPFEIMKPDTRGALTQEKNESEHSQHNEPEPSSPEMPPGFELIGVENLPHSGSRNPEIASSAEELSSESNRARRQLRRWSTSSPELKAVTMASPELNTSLKPDTKIDSPNLSLNSNQLEFHLSNDDEPQRKKLRRSVRARLAKPEAVLLSSNSKEEVKPEKQHLRRTKTHFSTRHSKDEMKSSETLATNTLNKLSSNSKEEEKPEKQHLQRMKTRFSTRHSKDETKSSETLTTNTLNKSKCQRPKRPAKYDL